MGLFNWLFGNEKKEYEPWDYHTSFGDLREFIAQGEEVDGPFTIKRMIYANNSGSTMERTTMCDGTECAVLLTDRPFPYIMFYKYDNYPQDSRIVQCVSTVDDFLSFLDRCIVDYGYSTRLGFMVSEPQDWYPDYYGPDGNCFYFQGQDHPKGRAPSSWVVVPG